MFMFMLIPAIETKRLSEYVYLPQQLNNSLYFRRNYFLLPGLTWSQCEDSFMLHALPTTHCTNYMESALTMDAGVYHTEMAALDYSGGIEDAGAEDFDYAMDCGDMLF